MFSGSIVALVTPFTKQGELDEERLRFLIDWHIKNKTDGILVCGTTGESATLSHQEHKQVIEIAVDQVKGRVPVIAGAGSNSTAEATELVKFAQQVKADGALVITPYYNKPTQQGMYKHFCTVAKAAALPIILYNVPGRTGVNLMPKTVAMLYKDCENIVGVKEASGSLDQIIQVMSLVDQKFLLLSGSDEVVVPTLSVGARGVISVVANVVPQQTHQMVESFLNGDIEQAKKMQLYLYELIKSLFIETNPIPVKTVLAMMGMIDSHLRLPLCSMQADNEQQLRAVARKYELVK